MSGRRVVVTGLGMLTPVGNDVAWSTWENILAGRSGARPSRPSTSPTSACASHRRVGEGLRRHAVHVGEGPRAIDIFVQYGMAAASRRSRTRGSRSRRTPRAGVAIGSGIGGIVTIEKHYAKLSKSGPRKVSPFFVPGSIINMISGNISIKYGLKGPNLAVGHGLHDRHAQHRSRRPRLIRDGDADVMVAGGAEMATSPVPLAAFSSMKALSSATTTRGASRPWDGIATASCSVTAPA